MWNRYRQSVDFKDGKQWLLRFFDQIRFYPVDADQLARMREDFPRGRLKLDIEPATLDIREYRRMLAAEAASIAAFKTRQQAAFEAERERWREQDAVTSSRSATNNPEENGAQASAVANDIPPGCIALSSPVTGSVWQLNVSAGQRVSEGAELLVVEAMKMEIPVTADEAAEVVEVRCARGRTVTAGETLAVLRPV
jgi:urea carboxylase